MRETRPQEMLRRRLEALDADRSGGFAKLEKYLATPAGEEHLGTIARFHASLESPRDVGEAPFQTGPQAFVALLEENPAFGDPRELEVALPVFGAVGPGEEDLRRDAADVLAAGAIAIVSARGGPSPEYFGALVRIAIGPDAFSELLRRGLLGKKPLPDFGDRPIPQKLLDLMREIDRRTCGLAVAHSLSNWGQAVTKAKWTAWATGITSISPAVGCAGVQVTISGSGFGAARPQGVLVAFARRGGGCTFASVVSWSDTTIVAVAPADVGSGCVGFVIIGDATELLSAASTLAGEMVRCMGMPAFTASERIRTFGSRPIIVCPPCLPLNVNYFRGGMPYIEYVSANGSTKAEIAPGAALTLSWSVQSADSITIDEVPAPPGQLDELPGVSGALSPTSGSYNFPSVPGTFTWDREYELRARNTCTPPNQPVTKRVTIRMRSRPDLSIGGIEATQATQFFAASVHMPNATARKADNAVALIASKPTIVRILVDSGQSPAFDSGIVPGVRAVLHGRTAAGSPLPGSPIAPLDPTFTPNPAHAIQARRRTPLTAQLIASERMLPATRSFLFRLPASWIGVGAIDVEARVISPAAVTETDPSNNRLTQRLVFNIGGLPIRIALLRVSYTDTPTGAVVPPPTLAQSMAELDFIQRVYPSNRSLLNVVPAPGGTPWLFGGDLTAGGPGCGMGWNLINAELVTRAFFNFGFEDRVFVALLNRPPSGNSGPAGGCGLPMSSLGGTVIGGMVLGGLVAGTIVLGPFAGIAIAAILARLGSSALGVASALVSAPGTPAGTGGTLAQEVGHGLGLAHVAGATAPGPFENSWPDYQGVGSGTSPAFQSIGEFGLDVDDSTGFTLRAYSPQSFVGIPVTTTDFMSYAGSSDWVSPFIYEKMMGGAIIPPPGFGPSPAKPLDRLLEEVEPIDVALVSGEIREDGAKLRPVFTHTRRFAFDDREPDWYRVELRADDGTVLEARRIQPLDHEHDGEPELPIIFATAVPFHPRTAQIVVMRRDHELVRQAVPREPPSLSAPRVSKTEHGWLAQWSAEHERSDDVRYLVRYAVGERDDEPLWQYLAAGLEEPRLELRRGVLAGGTARLQVGASVSGRTAWAESAPFDVPHSPPEVAVLAPPPDSHLQAGREVLLRGEALTLDGSHIDDAHFVWVSDRDGELGRGRSLERKLTLGRHTVRLRVEAPDRPAASAEVRLAVVQGRAPSERDPGHDGDNHHERPSEEHNHDHEPHR